MKQLFNNSLKFSILFVMLLFPLLGSSCLFKKNEITNLVTIPEHRARLLISEQGKPTALLRTLLEELKLAHDGTLPSIVAVTQKNLLRQAGKERWQATESLYEKNRSQLLPIFHDLCLFQKMNAKKQDYRYAVLLGSTVTSFRKRLAFFIEEWNRGIRCDQIIILAGQRPLDSELESTSILYDRSNNLVPIKATWQEPAIAPKTETEMMRMVFDQASLPADFMKIPIKIIDVAMQTKADGTMRRPTTGDTVQAWLSHNPQPGNCLVISNQPYIAYQDSVMRTLLPKNFSIETVGAGIASDQETVSTLLDTVARIVYQEYQLLERT